MNINNLILTKFIYTSKIHLNQLLNNGREKLGIKKLKDLKVIFHYSQTIDDVYEDLKDYNPTNKRKVSIVFDDMIAVWKLIKN